MLTEPFGVINRGGASRIMCEHAAHLGNEGWVVLCFFVSGFQLFQRGDERFAYVSAAIVSKVS